MGKARRVCSAPLAGFHWAVTKDLLRLLKLAVAYGLKIHSLATSLEKQQFLAALDSGPLGCSLNGRLCEEGLGKLADLDPMCPFFPPVRFACHSKRHRVSWAQKPGRHLRLHESPCWTLALCRTG